jgi:hypothetical protein
MSSILRRGIPIVASFAAAFLVRFELVEPATLAHLCESAAAPWWCAPRAAVIAAFASGALAAVSVGAGVAATVTRSARWALGAACLGAAGLVLFSYQAGAVALLLGLLVLARRQGTRRQHAA